MDIMLRLLFLTFIGILAVSSVRRHDPILKVIYFTLLPFAAPLNLAYGIYLTFDDGPAARETAPVYFVCAIIWYLVWRKDKDKDDRWKRWRKKLAEKVAVANGRLEVVDA